MEGRFERKEDKPPRNLTLLAFGKKAGKVPLKRVFFLGGGTPMTIKGRGVTTQGATTSMMSAFQSSKFVSCFMFNMCIKSSILRSFAATPKLPPRREQGARKARPRHKEGRGGDEERRAFGGGNRDEQDPATPPQVGRSLKATQIGHRYLEVCRRKKLGPGVCPRPPT